MRSFLGSGGSHREHPVAAFLPVLSALLVVVVTAMLAGRREREADWRKLKYVQYQEYLAALSGIVEGRVSAEAQRRHADTVDSLLLVAPEPVLPARDAFLSANACGKPPLPRDEHDRLLNDLLRAMRRDIHRRTRVSERYRFFLQAPPPDPAVP